MKDDSAVRFTQYNPTRVHFGRGQIEQLPLAFPAQAASRIMLVTDPDGARLSGALDGTIRQFPDRELLLFDEIMENPTYEIVDRAAELARVRRVDLIVGIGGGSAMDAAKGIALTCQQSRPVQAFIEGRQIDSRPLPIVCVPTTAGTGSEVTPFMVLTDVARGIKQGYESEHIYPALAIVDPCFCDSMPAGLALNTGLDALTHAVEAYLSTLPHPATDALALDALGVVIASLKAAMSKDPSAIDAMSFAAMEAGLAISQKSTILLHILAYPLTHCHHIPHGLANALLLPAVLDFLSQEGQCDRKLNRIASLFDAGGGVRGFLESLGVRLSLSHYGVRPDAFPHYADQTLVKGDIAITPASIDRKKLISIYEDAL